MALKNFDLKTSRHRSLLTAALLLSAWAGSAAANPISCTQGELSRTVEIIYTEPGQPVPCEVIYAKPAAGTIELLWQAMNEAGYCEQQTAGLIEKLQGSGWRCSKQADEAPEESESDY